MIHVIPHHIGKGSYAPWYDLIHFEEEVTYYPFDDKDIIENKLQGESPYVDSFIQKLNKINPKKGDIVIFDVRYLYNYDNQDDFYKYINELSSKYNNCKFVMFDDDNFFSHKIDTNFVIFSNRFDTDSNFDLNCNYFRYRFKHQEISKYIGPILKTFQTNIRQKKMNMIIGVDKKERLQIFKYVHNIGLQNDSWLAYSAFTSTYSDSELSDSLLEFKNTKIPTILDTPYERSLVGNVNVEVPPLPITMTSYVSCILETMVMGTNELHLSEKSWNPFISKTIPLILGNTYINQYLKSIGFWLADDIFDLTPKSTTESIIIQYMKNLDVLNELSFKQLHDYYQMNLDKIEHNLELIMKQKFTFNKNNYK